jgi:hypothetical protein
MITVDVTIPRVSRSLRWAAAALVAICVVAASVPAVARADGDPGSDVLVYQNLFAGSDAGLSVQQQLALGRLLKSAARAGVPVRVAIIAGPADLGAVTALWRNPRGYARFLGIELSLAYKGRLLVVMPNGFGFNWPGHSPESAYRLLAGIPIRAGGDGVYSATSAAVINTARAAGVRLTGAASSPSAPAQSAGTGSAGSAGGAAPASGHAPITRLGSSCCR